MMILGGHGYDKHISIAIMIVNGVFFYLLLHEQGNALAVDGDIYFEVCRIECPKHRSGLVLMHRGCRRETHRADINLVNARCALHRNAFRSYNSTRW